MSKILGTPGDVLSLKVELEALHVGFKNLIMLVNRFDGKRT